MKQVLAIISIICLSWISVHAQQVGDTGRSEAKSGSVYSSLGVGIPVDFGNSSADGMGLSGVSFNETFVPGIANPAVWGNTIYGMATGGLNLQNFSATDRQNSNTNTLFEVDYFQIQLPLIRQKLGLSVSFSPFTDGSFRFIENETIIIGSGLTQDTLNTRTENTGSGGINSVEVGLGWKINSNISIGYAASAMLTSIEEDFSTTFQSLDFSPVNFTRKTSGIGFGSRAGFKIDLPSIFSESDELTIGSSISIPVTIEADREEVTSDQSTNFSEIVVDEGENLGKGEIDLPLTWHAGVTYSLNETVSFSTEGLYENWSTYSNDFDNQEDRLTDRYKVGLGLRYFPYVKDSDRFLSNFKYRVGLSYDTGHLEITGERIDTKMVSVGLGILSPRSNSFSSIDISFHYGIRGTTANSLVKENFWGLGLSLNLAELMFTRPKLR